MKNRFLLLLFAVGCVAADWRIAEPGWRYEFPRDHHAHREFKTEWWYFTGNLADASGRRFGYQLTFFRQGIIPPAQRVPERSRFVVDDLKFAHFTITDVAGRKFHFEQKTSRGAFGEAGFDDGERLAWLDSWELKMDDAGAFRLRAEGKEMALDLRLVSRKPPVIHGADGISQKAAGEGHASHYYSLTRLATEGVSARGRREFSRRRARAGSITNGRPISSRQEQVGWDWLSVHLDDGTELMLYRMRLADGATDPTSSGTFVEAGGALAASAERRFPDDASAFLAEREIAGEISDRLAGGVAEFGVAVRGASGAGKSGTRALAARLLGGRGRNKRHARRESRSAAVATWN